MELDLCLCAYNEHLRQDGETKGLAGDTLSGLEYFIKPLRGKVRGAWRVFTAWTKKELPNQAPPLPIGVMFALVGLFFTVDMVGVAAGIALGFHNLLRTGEIFNLRCKDVVLGSKSGVVMLRQTKKGIPDIVSICDPFVAKVVAERLKVGKPSDYFVDVPPQRGRVLLGVALLFLGLEDCEFRWYSLRRGGATHWFQKTGSMDSTLKRGRWEAPRTAKLYITEGTLALVDSVLSDATKVAMRFCIGKLFSRLGKVE